VEGSYFDHLARSLTGSRRSLFGGVMVSAASWLGISGANAKKKRRKKNKKPKRTDHVCLAVSQACNGDGTRCCSGICEGEQPKKGRTDASHCVAGGANICDGQADYCTTGVATTCNPLNPKCTCLRTTSEAPFCGDVSAEAAVLCRPCRPDADCEAEFGPGAACVVVGGSCGSYCPDTGNTACVRACTDDRM
jgi:hypothetical protein